VSSRLRRIAENEAAFRDRNERRRRSANVVVDELVDFVCECGSARCEAEMLLTIDEYEKVRGYGGRFAVLVDHVIPAAESLVEQFDRYAVVEKHSESKRNSEERNPRSSLKTCTVLVVDDVVEVRILLKMLLQLEPTCTIVAEAGNGREAVEAARAAQPEVVILDIEMPVMNGYDALPLIMEAVPTTKVIVFSGSGEVDERRLASSGVFDVVPKGGDPSVLINTIKDVALSGANRAKHLQATGVDPPSGP
jgi:CheY-like chemotaxis protein